MRLFFVSLRTALIYWVIFLCYCKVTGKSQKVHRQNFENYKYHKTLNYEVSTIKAPVLYTGSINHLNYLKFKKREVAFVNGEFQTDFSNTQKEGAVVTEGTNEERKHTSSHFTSSGSIQQLYMSTQSMEIIEDSGNYTSTNNEQIPLKASTYSYESQDTVFMPCLKTVCNKSEESAIVIYPERTAVLIGSNLSFTCTLTINNTQKGHVFWAPTEQYLSSITIGNDTVLYFENAKLSDSGVYKCVKWHDDNCCHVSTVLKVYSYPPYATHLIIIGTVASVAFLVCVVVEIWRNFHMQQYSKSQFKEQEKEEELLLR